MSMPTTNASLTPVPDQHNWRPPPARCPSITPRKPTRTTPLKPLRAMPHSPGRPYRPLPRPLTPAHDETLSSYLHRLAQSNRLDATALRTYLTGSSRAGAPVPVDHLARVTGHPARTLRYAIIELNTSEERQRTHLAHRPRPGLIRRLRCTHCTRARGHRGHVWSWSHPEHVVCHRHQRWTGGGDEPGHTTQPNLRQHPEILRAHRRHLKLIHRHGRTTITTVFNQATAICTKWHTRFEHREHYEQLMTRFHGPGWRVPLSDPTVAAARYPQTIELTTLLVSPPQTIQLQRQWPEPTQFTQAVRHTVAPDFHWSLTTHYGYLDPLVSLTLDRIKPVQIPTHNPQTPNKELQLDETTRQKSI